MCVVKYANGKTAVVSGVYNIYDLVAAIDGGTVGNPIHAEIGGCKYSRKDFSLVRDEMRCLPPCEE